MSIARGHNIAVMAADLQEPPELVIEFFRATGHGDVDVVAGERASRATEETGPPSSTGACTGAS